MFRWLGQPVRKFSLGIFVIAWQLSLTSNMQSVAFAQDMVAPTNFSEAPIAASADVIGTGTSGVNGRTGARGYYTCSKMTWGDACADIYKWGKAKPSHSKAGSNAPGGTSTTETTNSNEQVADVTGNGSVGNYVLDVTSVATSQTWSSAGDSGLRRNVVLNGGQAFTLTISHEDGSPPIEISAPAGTTLESLNGLINDHAGEMVGGSLTKRFTASLDESQLDSESVLTDVLTISGPLGAGNDFTISIDWGSAPGTNIIELKTPVATQVGTDPSKAISADNPAVTVYPVGMTSTNAVYTIDGTPGSSSSNSIEVGGLNVNLLATGTTTLSIESLSSVVGNGADGNAGLAASGHSQSYSFNNIHTDGQTAIAWASTGGNAGSAQQGGQGGQGGTGGQALADTAPIIFFMPFPPITVPSTQSIAMNGGTGGQGAQGGTGGVGGLGGAGGPLSLTLTANNVRAQTIASLTSTGGVGGIGGLGGTGGQGGTGGAAHASKESSNLVMNAISAMGGAGGLGGKGGQGGLGNQGGTGGHVSLNATVGSAEVETGFELKSLGGAGGAGGQGGVGGQGGTGGAGAAIVFEVDAGGLTENARAASDGASGGAGGAGFAGGTGGKGGTGGSVDVIFSGNLNSSKSAIVATSEGAVGGTGGKGGTGGDGGSGGDGAAEGFGTGSVSQTIASQGGAGGTAGTGGTGGVGGTGGQGGNVTVSLTDAAGIITSGQSAIVAQSLGGVGGTGGDGGDGGQGGVGGKGDWVRSVTGVDISEDFNLSLLVKHYHDESNGGAGGKGGSNGAGGAGGDGGAGGTVTVTNHQQIRTTGSSNAAGIVAQSLGAIGGTGGAVGTVGTGGDGGVGGNSCLPHSTDSCIYGSKASDGASGASGNVNPDAVVGAASYVGGNGGNVTVTNHGAVETQGARSAAISAQSIGGVQGLADFDPYAVNWDGLPSGAQQSSSGTVSITNSGALTTTGDESVGLLALSQGSDGSSGNITISSTGDISTSGDKSSAIIAKSSVLDVARAGAPDSTGGTAGDVTITHSGGDIVLGGADAAAVIAQSHSNAVATDTGDVSVTLADAKITGSAKSSTGALVQASSISEDGNAGDVTVENSADVECVADDCVAFELASNGKTPAENGNLSLTNSGTIEGGKGGSAVVLNGGKTNRVINENSASGKQATMRTKGGINDTIIKGSDGDDEIINRNGALLVGNLDLGAGINSLTNGVGSTYNSGNNIDLGGGTFTNNGTFSPGGLDNSMNPANSNGRTVLNGDFNQGSTGELEINLDFGTGSGASDYADIFHVTGTAHLDGLLTLEPLNGAGKPGEFKVPVFTVDGGFAGPGLTLNDKFASGEPSTTAVFKPSTSQEGNTQYVSYKVDYKPDGLTPNASNVGDRVNEIQNAGVPAYQPIADELLRQPTLADLQRAYDSLSGEGVSASQQAALGANAQRGSNLFSSLNGFAFCSGAAGDEKSECSQQTRYWFNGSTSTTYEDGNANTASTKKASQSMQSGIELRPTAQALFGFAVDMNTTGFAVKDRWTSGRTEGLSTTAYGMAWTDLGFFAKGLFSTSMNANTTSRLALQRYVGGAFTSYTVGSSLEFGMRLGDDHLAFMPSVGFATDFLFQPSWSEGNNTYGNYYHGQVVHSNRLNLGIGFDAEVPMAEGMIGRIATNAMYERELTPERGNRAESLAAAGYDWETAGLSAPSDKVKLDLGLTFNPADNVTLTIKASHMLYAGGSSTSASVSLKGRF